DLEFLHDISSRFAAEDPLDQDLERIIEFSSAVVKCDSCFIYIRDGEELVLRASKNPHGEVVGRLKLALGQGITGWVAEHREPVAVSQNASQDARFQTFQELPDDTFEAFLSVPILSRGRVVGVINLQHREPHTYTARQIRLISMIGFLVGTEIEMARLEGENSQLLQKLETRKLLERAKGILQRDLGLDEEQAYLTLQRQARQKRRALKEIAEAVVLGEEIRRGSGTN
ncbi:MAG TPA: GAF domain-containing protein, partial [Terriglobales bacterium]|nr:GAF domain-containing protein [Terriglobales bacterium]